jgi:hypothetical protein
MANIKDPVVAKAVKDFCDEMSASFSRTQGEKDFQKEAVSLLAEKHELDKKILKKMAKTYHASNFATQKQDQAEFEETYEALFGPQE